MDRSGPLSARTATDGDLIRPGRVYVAPPDQHLLVIKDEARLSRAPRQNGVRPAADPLFRSAALHAGPRVTAVVVRQELRPVELHDVEWQRPGGQEPSYYDVAIVPLFAAPGDLLGVGVSFVDVTRYRRVRDELAHANTELERAYEELQSLNEELETTNEELETMNEELQSTNDELQTINDELRGRTEELDQANSFLGSVLRSLGSAVIVLNEDLKVRVWSPGAEDLWGLRPEEAENTEMLSLDIGLPVASIEPMLRHVLTDVSGDGASAGPVGEVTAVNRRGKTVELRITASPMRTEEGGISGVILVIDHQSP